MYQQIAPPRTYVLGTCALQGPLYLFLLPHTHFRVSVKVAGNYRFLEKVLKMEPDGTELSPTLPRGQPQNSSLVS